MNYVIKVLVALLFTGSMAFGQVEKRINKEFNNPVFTTLEIHNSFGDIIISPSSGSKIEVNITISVENVKGDKASEFLDNIKFDFVEKGSTLVITTNRPEDKGRWNKVVDFRMDYQVKIPDDLNLDITNNFGDIRINGTKGNLKMAVSHGDCFIAFAHGRQNDLNVQFGDVRIESIYTSKLDIQHGDLDIDKAEDLNLHSHFGDINISRLGGNSILKIAHGDIEIENVASTHQSLAIEVQFGDVDISGLSAHDLDIHLSGNFASFSWDKTWQTSNQNEDFNSSNYQLKTVPHSTVGKRLKIDASHSDVDLD